MIRTFDEWWSSLSDDQKEKDHEKASNFPSLNQVNYIWVTNVNNRVTEELNPTTEELLEWIKDGQVNAIRK